MGHGFCVAKLMLSHFLVCPDVDECKDHNGGCHEQRECTNTAGSMKCEDCAAGRINDGDKGCKGLCRLVD